MSGFLRARSWMRTPRLSRLDVIALAAAASWSPFAVRCLDLRAWALEYYEDSPTINASNDLVYANALCTFCLLALSSGAAAWWRSRRRSHRVFGTNVLLLLLISGLSFSIWAPTSPIHLFPELPLGTMFILATSALMIALLFPRGDAQPRAKSTRAAMSAMTGQRP